MPTPPSTAKVLNELARGFKADEMARGGGIPVNQQFPPLPPFPAEFTTRFPEMAKWHADMEAWFRRAKAGGVI